LLAKIIYISIKLFFYAIKKCLQKINIYNNNNCMNKKKTFSTRVEEERLKALKHLAVDEDKSIGTLLEEAIDDLIKKYEKNKKR